MLDFLREIEYWKQKLKVVKLGIKDISLVREIIIKALGLNNINELRDKFEGVAFYENFLKKISGVLALENMLKTELVNKDTIDPKGYIPLIHIENNPILVITIDFGEFPKFPNNTNLPIILIVRKEERILWVIGFSDSKKENVNPNQKTFGDLRPFNNLSELKKLMN